MKKLILICILLCTGLGVFSQTDSTYINRLYYTCKVWGYVKYFHSEVADCNLNWNDSLLAVLPDIKTASDNNEFNNILLELINSAGETALPTAPAPVIPDSLRLNLDLDWFQDTILSGDVKTALDTIESRFRPREHCLVNEAFINGNPTFDTDNQYYSTAGFFPDEDIRVLGLFRYWNIINYFFPYKMIMDQHWDSTLLESLPWFLEAGTDDEYGLAWKMIAKRINDSHAFTQGGTLNPYFGYWFPDFNIQQIEGETVITQCSETTGLRPGDIIREIDGFDIQILRDSLKQYAHGSNDESVDYETNNLLIKGELDSFDILVENDTGLISLTLNRSHSEPYYVEPGPVWYDTLIGDACYFGYVDMAQLDADDIEEMMNDLWNTEVIVFDIRNYPQGTLWYLVYYLFTEPLFIANFTVPDIEYAGTHHWFEEHIGGYSSDIYDGNIIILFNEFTISQAEYTCMGLEQFPGATKIGSTTRAADGNVSFIHLPGYIKSIFTGLGTYYPDYSPTQRIGILPDIEILPTIQGIREGRDEVLEAAFDCGFIGVKEIPFSDSHVSIFPNPFTDQLIINLDQVDQATELRLYGISGKLVMEIPLGFETNEISLNLALLDKGCYIMKIVSEHGIVVRKIIKH